MIKESFIKPTDYKKWFTDKEVFCDTGSLINKFMTNTEIKEILWGLTDCLKDFFVAVKGIVKDIDLIYEKKYFTKPFVCYLIHLKQDVCYRIIKLLDNSSAATNGKFSGSEFIDLSKLVQKDIITTEEKELIQYSLDFYHAEFVSDLDVGVLYISTDWSEYSRDVYFSIKENTHVNMDDSSQFVMNAPFEIEPGLINLKSWAVYELYRLFKMTEICCKILLENADTKKDILANNFDGTQLISVFEELNKQ